MHNSASPLGRRAFLKNGSLFLAALGASAFAEEKTSDVATSFGLVTDLHYADKASSGTRHYRETLTKLAEAAKQFEKDKPAFLIELGDLIDAADTVEKEQGYLKAVNKVFSAISKDRHYVLGNHCVDMLNKEEFLDGVEQKKSYYSFDSNGIHFVILDACFKSDGKPYGRKSSKWNDANVPAAQVDWLTEDLKATKNKTIVFSHQRLDVTNDYKIKNAEEIRKVLEKSGKVLAAFHGHSHKNDYKEIAGIHYCTMVAMIEGSGAENNGYSTVRVHADGRIAITGFRTQKSYTWAKKS